MCIVEGVFKKDVSGSRRGSRSGQENINVNQSHHSLNSQNQQEGLPPRSHSTGHTRPSTTSSGMRNIPSSAVHLPEASSLLSQTGMSSSGSSQGKEKNLRQQYRNDLAISSSSRDSTDALSLSLDSQRERPRSSSNPVQPNKTSSTATAAAAAVAAFPYANVRTSAGAGGASSTAATSPLTISTPTAISGSNSSGSYSKGIQSAPKPQSSSTYQSSHQHLAFFGMETDVRKSLPLTATTTTTATTQQKSSSVIENMEKVLPLTRKDSKQAWNEKGRS